MNSREAFEAWYVENAFDYVENPIGSRECGLQYKAWQASRKQLLKELSESEPVAWMFPDDLKRFECEETFAQAFSVCVGSPDGLSVGLIIRPTEEE